jgi:lysophospholipase L1-like esterase
LCFFELLDGDSGQVGKIGRRWRLAVLALGRFGVEPAVQELGLFTDFFGAKNFWIKRPMKLRCSLAIFTLAVLLLSGLLFSGTALAVEPIRVENRGVPGNNSGQGLARLERELEKVRPQHVVIYFGINDSCNPNKLLSLQQYSANIGAMVDKSLAAGVKNVVLITPNPVCDEYLTMRHPKHPSGGRFQQRVDKYDAALREVAKEKRLPVAELRKLCEAHGGAKIVKESLIRNELNSDSKDGVHLTAEGYRRMARIVADILANKVEPGDTVLCLGDSITYGSAMQGKGTARGETYPAWLWAFLNNQKSPLATKATEKK